MLPYIVFYIHIWENAYKTHLIKLHFLQNRIMKFTPSIPRRTRSDHLYDEVNKLKIKKLYIYPVLCPKLTLIQPTWSAYPYHLVFLIWYPYSLVFLMCYPYALTSLYGNTAHCSGYGVAMGCYGLFFVTRTAIVTSQWYDRNCFTEYARTWARHQTTPWQRECTAITDRQFFFGFNVICYAFLRNNPIYIEGRNCGFSTVPVLFNKCAGLWPSDTLSSWWLGWRCHARAGKPFFGTNIGFMLSKLHYCLVNYIFVLDKRNTPWLRDTVRQTSHWKSAAGASAWPYCVTTQ